MAEPDSPSAFEGMLFSDTLPNNDKAASKLVLNQESVSIAATLNSQSYKYIDFRISDGKESQKGEECKRSMLYCS